MTKGFALRMADSPPLGRGDLDSGPQDLRTNSEARKKSPAVVMTTQPGNESELQLYRVLQRANLLNYYDTFISQGGDDVQQLCEAGEEEFLEIMALVGMASKPLHVRRLQKALQEWVQNPGLFQSPLVSSIGGFHSSPAAAAAAVIRASGNVAIPTVTVAPSIMGSGGGVSVSTSLFGGSLASVTGSGAGISVSAGGATGVHHSTVLGAASPHSGLPPALVPTSVSQLLAQTRAIAAAVPSAAISPPVSIYAPPISMATASSGMHHLPTRPRSRNTPPSSSGLLKAERTSNDNPISLISPAITTANLRPASFSGLAVGGRDNSDSEGSGNGIQPPNSAPSPPTSGAPHNSGDIPHPGTSTSPMQLQPVLVESQIQRIADAAAGLVKSLPDLEPKTPNVKKKICKELELVMSMNEEGEKKMEEIRKFSAIYGRFDCKRKQDKPLTLHEVSVNEAAAQICRLVPAMLTRRDELFPLARQVVRDSGYQYSKGHSRSTFSLTGKLFNGEEAPFKRMRFSEDSEITQRRRERLDQISEESRLISDRLDELRTAGGSCRTAGDLPQLQQISQQLELLQSKQQQLSLEKDEHQRYIRYSSRMSTSSDPDKGDTDDDTSQRSYSNASSPSASMQGPHNFVLSASGGQIIAVQNPALSLCGAFSASAASAGRGSPPISVQSSSSVAGLRGTPPRHTTGSPNTAAITIGTLKQEPSSPPPVSSYTSHRPHSRD